MTKCDYCEREAYATIIEYYTKEQLVDEIPFIDYKECIGYEYNVCRVHNCDIVDVSISENSFGEKSTIYHHADGFDEIVNGIADVETFNMIGKRTWR